MNLILGSKYSAQSFQPNLNYSQAEGKLKADLRLAIKTAAEYKSIYLAS